MIKNKLFLAYIILAFNAAFIESSNMVIKNAEIYDGIENNSYQGHILIRDGVIAKISKTSVPYADKVYDAKGKIITPGFIACLLYTSPSPRDVEESRMPSSA